MGVYVDIMAEYFGKDNKWHLAPVFINNKESKEYAVLMSGQSWLYSILKEFITDGIVDKVSVKDFSDDYKNTFKSNTEDEAIEAYVFNMQNLLRLSEVKGDNEGWVTEAAWNRYIATGEEPLYINDEDLLKAGKETSQAILAHRTYRHWYNYDSPTRMAQTLIQSINVLKNIFFWNEISEADFRLIATASW